MEEKEDEGTVLCEEYQIFKTLIFVNSVNDVVIKQKNDFYDQEMIIFINPAYIQKLIDMLYECQDYILYQSQNNSSNEE